MKLTRVINTTPKRLLWVAGIVVVALALFLMQEPTVGPGDTVVIDYVISINGIIADTSIEEIAHKAKIFDENREYKSLVILIGGRPGEDAVAPPVVEQALLGMKVGEEKVLKLNPLDAYGYWKEENLIKMNKQEFIERSGIEPEQGETYQWGNRRCNVYQLTEEFVYLDFNHRLAVNPNKVVVPRGEFEQTADARVGNVVYYQGQPAIVIETTDTEVVLDVNFAVFEFRVEVIQIKKG